jgi:hypothetical protein
MSCRRRMARLARAFSLVVAGASGCGEWVSTTEFCSDHLLTLEGVVPVPFDAFAAGGLTWCVGTGCTTARVLQPLRPSPHHWDWYEMSSGGRARPVDPGSTELYVFTREEPTSNIVTVTVTDASGSVVLETEQIVDFHRDYPATYCFTGKLTIGADPDAGSDAGPDA